MLHGFGLDRNRLAKYLAGLEGKTAAFRRFDYVVPGKKDGMVQDAGILTALEWMLVMMPFKCEFGQEAWPNFEVCGFTCVEAGAGI